MSEPGEPRPEAIQFDEAEFADEAPAVPVCTACHREIAGEYYEANQQLLCAACRVAVGEAMAGGSGAGRFLRACVFGALAAVAGFAIYFGLLKLTGYEIGLVSVLVGLMVGKAVRAGSGNRGGLVYQLLAVFLVYTAVVASYSSLILPELIQQADAKHKAEPAKAGAPAPAAAPAKADRPAVASAGGVAVAALMLLAFLYALPVLVGIQAPIGLLIVGFALWEAWKINRRVRVVFNGPFRIGDEGPGHAPTVGVPGHA